MPKTRVLVVDDAIVMRRLLTEVLQRDPQIEVVGTAPNGRIALQKLTQLNPDVVTLDVEMPELDGLATLRELRRDFPRLPVIMLSLLTQRGAAATLDALAAGANDYVTKPSDVSNIQEAIARLGADLIPKIHAQCRPFASPPVTPIAPLRTRTSRHVELICIATSTGGPNALSDVFRGFNKPLPVPIAIVQHMPPMFTALLAARLDAGGGPVRCVEARDGEKMQAGCAYLAPGGRHLAVLRDTAGTFTAQLLDTAPENSCRPAADVLFRSAAATGAGLLAVVMTGMGSDGMRGCELVLEQRGHVLAQDEATSVVWGMPGSVVHAGFADQILPLPKIASEITRRTMLGRLPSP